MKQAHSPEWTWPVLLAYTLFLMWAAHASVFFAHEYAHSFTAWLLGWKSDPLALYYPHPTLIVFLLQMGINQSVDEGPIFASGHGAQAALIGGAGALLGNGLISYGLSRWGYWKARQIGSRGWAMFAYWATVASAGNFLDYVPVRTFTTEGDIGSIERGFGCSPWIILVVLGVPTLLALTYFFVRIEPVTLSWLFPEAGAKRYFIVFLTAFAIFGFYGAAGWFEGGPISHVLSVISVCICFPVMAALGGIQLRHAVTRQPLSEE